MTDEIKRAKTSDLTPDANNANRGTQRGAAMLESSLRKYGAGRSILLDRKGRVIAGNKTLQQAVDIGLDDVIIVKTDGRQLVAVQREDLDLADDDNDARALAYADNRVGQVDLDFDPAVILADINAGVDLGGLWSDDELAAIIGDLAGGGTEGGEPADVTETEAEKLAKQYGVQPGQVWQLGRHVIACLDCLDRGNVERLVDGQTVGMVWADPPYSIRAVDEKTGQVGGLGRPGGGYPFGGSKNDGKSKPIKSNVYAEVIGDKTTETAKASFVLLCDLYPKTVHLWWGGNYYTDVLPPSPGWVVWDKDNGTNAFADCEMAWTNQDRAARIFEHRWNGMLKASEQGQRRVHPTQKPTALPVWCFENYGKPGDLILDPFLGSGISVLAAEQLNDDRRVVGFELAPAYIGATIHRWQQLTNQDPCLL